MPKRALTLIEKFKLLALEATAEELRLMSLLADFRRDGLIGHVRTVEEPRKKAEPAKVRKTGNTEIAESIKKSRLSPADSAAMQQDAQREG